MWGLIVRLLIKYCGWVYIDSSSRGKRKISVFLNIYAQLICSMYNNTTQCRNNKRCKTFSTVTPKSTNDNYLHNLTTHN